MQAQLETFSKDIEKVKQFFADQWQETAMGKPDELDPDYDTYIELEKSNRLVFVTLNDGSETVGYFVGIVNNLLQSRKKKALIQTDLYIKPAIRNCGGLRLLLRKAEEEAKKLGATEAMYSKRDMRGNRKIETYYTKVI